MEQQVVEHNEISRKAVVLLLIGIIIIAGGLRLYGLDRQSLWYDEAIEEKDFQILLDMILYNQEQTPDVRPPLNPFFVYLMTKTFPGSDFALRMPAFAFGLISIPLLYVLGRRLFNKEVGLIAALLLAISPFHIWYSQDARMYTLMWMLSLISLIYFVRALEQPLRRNFICYLISTEAALYTHQFAVFLVLLQGLYLLLSFRKVQAQFLKWLGMMILLIILYLPWLIYSLTALMGKALGGPFKPIDIYLIMYTIYSYCVGFSIGPSVRELHFDKSLAAIKPYIAIIGSIIGVYCTLFFLGLLSIRKFTSKAMLPLLILIVPISSVIILIIVKPEMAYNVRYTAVSFFAFLLFIASGVHWLWHFKNKQVGRIMAVLAIIVMMGFSAYAYTNYQFDKRYHKEDIRGVVAYINEKRTDGDELIIIGGCAGGIFERYSGGIIHCENSPLFTGIIRATQSTFKINKETIEVEMLKRIEGKKRLWLVVMQEWNWYINMSSYFAKAWLDTNYEEIKSLHRGIDDIANTHIFCYDLTEHLN